MIRSDLQLITGMKTTKKEILWVNLFSSFLMWLLKIVTDFADFYGILRHFVAFRSILWHFAAFCGILWHFVEYCGTRMLASLAFSRGFEHYVEENSDQFQPFEKFAEELMI